jgi:hypothetical protein
MQLWESGSIADSRRACLGVQSLFLPFPRRRLRCCLPLWSTLCLVLVASHIGRRRPGRFCLGGMMARGKPIWQRPLVGASIQIRHSAKRQSDSPVETSSVQRLSIRQGHANRALRAERLASTRELTPRALQGRRRTKIRRGLRSHECRRRQTASHGSIGPGI